MSKKSPDESVVVRPAEAEPDPEAVAAQRSWLRDGTVPLSYVETSLRGSASTAQIPSAVEILSTNSRT